MRDLLKKAKFVFYASNNGRDGWELVEQKDVPAWITGDPDVLGNLVNGFIAMKCDEGEKGSLHYRADVTLGAQDAAKLKAALSARDTREAERVLVAQPSKDHFIAAEQSKLEH